MYIFLKAFKESYFECHQQSPEGLLVDLNLKRKKKNDKKEKGVLECRPHLHAGFSTIGCLPLSETELLP